jgi:heme oxygenase
MYTLYKDVSQMYTLYKDVSQMYTLYKDVSRMYTLYKDVSRMYTLYKDVSRMYTLYKAIDEIYFNSDSDKVDFNHGLTEMPFVLHLKTVLEKKRFSKNVLHVLPKP